LADSARQLRGAGLFFGNFVVFLAAKRQPDDFNSIVFKFVSGDVRLFQLVRILLAAEEK